METYEIKIKNTKIKIFSFLKEANLLRNKRKFIESVIEEIKEDNKDGFAGFLDRKGFKSHIESWILGGPLVNKKYPINRISAKKCSEIIKEVFEKISKVLDKRGISIYLFPTLSKFTIDKMGGSGGVLIWKNIIYIEVFPKKGWEKHFKSSLVHEIAHTFSPHFNVNSMKIGEGFIFDGIAEHFQEKFVGIKSPWTKAILKREVLRILKEIKPNLNKESNKLYNELFYGTGKYPFWTGYTIGYYLIEKYLKKQRKINWGEILRKDPNKILKKLLFNIK